MNNWAQMFSFENSCSGCQVIKFLKGEIVKKRISVGINNTENCHFGMNSMNCVL